MNMREKIAERIRHHATGAHWTPEGLADAVLDALMEPTEGMIEAGVLDTKADVSFFDVEETFSAMIQAAKEGG